MKQPGFTAEAAIQRGRNYVASSTPTLYGSSSQIGPAQFNCVITGCYSAVNLLDCERDAKFWQDQPGFSASCTLGTGCDSQFPWGLRVCF
jgi:hypothetical protein